MTTGGTIDFPHHLPRNLWSWSAFFVAALAALAVLFGLGAIWAGDELRAAAPNDPMIRDGAPIFGMVLFAGTVGPALTALPALIAVVAGEVISGSLVDVLRGGGRAVARRDPRPCRAGDGAELSAILASHAMTIFATAGFAGGFVYWLLAGARA